MADSFVKITRHLIVSKVTGTALFPRDHMKPFVWAGPEVGKWPEQYFQLLPGKGKRAGYFCLRSKQTDSVVFSRFRQKPEVWSHLTHEDHDDQYFCFDFEDSVVDRVEYDLGAGTILSKTPQVIGQQTVRNYSERHQGTVLEFQCAPSS